MHGKARFHGTVMSLDDSPGLVLTTRGRLEPIFRPLNDRYGTYRGLLRLWLAQAELLAGRLEPFVNIDLRAAQRLVFVCQGNICRSSFAEATARSLGLEAASFGLATSNDAPAFPLAIDIARRLGVDLSDHRTRQLEGFRFAEGDLLLAMEIRQARQLQKLLPRHLAQISLLGLWHHTRRPHIHDPHHLSPMYFETCFRVISESVQHLGAALKVARRISS